ncbi:DUF3667 domain-containing protein [Spongiivirga sp. MCCC 1A20706]|uniref:DUF3667 domain-containing protein n=1 Tax=Spongiivirga sp. MCCC 1A20706 TaxID=3160963 RepID=UPI0039774052
MNCKNCEIRLQEDATYCHNCGARVIKNRLTLRNLFEHISETFFNYDNKLLRTFLTLAKKPEQVVGGYVKGIRKRYVNPISFFGLSITISGLSIFLIKRFYLEYFDMGKWFLQFEVFNNEGSKKMLENMSAGDTMEYSSLMFSIIIPVFALLSWIIFLDKKYNFTEHIVLYLYTMSGLSILTVILGQIILLISPTNYISFIFLTYPVLLLYHCYALKRIFELNFGQLILRTFLFLFLFGVTYIIIGIASFIIGLFMGTYDMQSFAPPK